MEICSASRERNDCSGGDSHAEGVFQILYPGIWNAWAPKCGHGGEDPYDATANVAVAACMQAADGWAPWGL